MSRFDDGAAVYAWLARRLNLERKLEVGAYRLDRMEALVERAGRPDRGYRIVHVAGSKGKGSISSMTASGLVAAGLRTGLYTSPHFLDWRERIAVDGRPAGDELLLPAAETLAELVETAAPEDWPGEEEPTYFELLTMLAFLSFERAGCEAAVIETGLGGRLDSTNVVRPAISLIGPIELEHTELLGDTIPKIAAEKAGIVKPGVPVIASARRPEAVETIRNAAGARGAPFAALVDVARIRDLRVDARGTEFELELHASLPGLGDEQVRLRTAFCGTAQAENSAMAYLALRFLGVERGIAAAGIARARLPARFQTLPGEPVVILDGAHTEDSIRLAVETFSSIFPGGGELLFGCAKDKHAEAMAEVLAGAFLRAVVTRPGTFKESDPERDGRAIAAAGLLVRVEPETSAAVDLALEAAKQSGKPLLVTGSFYLCAEAAARLIALGRDVPSSFMDR